MTSKQLRAGTDSGSLVNVLTSGMRSAEPAVGMGATILGWTDRTAATVVEVGLNYVVVQCDRVARTDTRGMCEVQSYSFERNTEGVRRMFKRSKDGTWRAAEISEHGRVVLSHGGNGARVMLGYRDHYYDFSF